MAGVAGRFHPARLIASGFGSGYSPYAPGTAGSLAALLLGVPLLLGGHVPLAGAALLATLVGLWAVRRVGATDDPGWVVVDEFAGQWIAMLALPQPSWLGFALAFGLFRLFDVLKPGPIGWADRQEGAVGVMLDDVLAGAAAAAVIAGIRLLQPGLL